MAASLAFLASSSNGLVETDQCHVCSLSGVNLLNFDPFDATPALVLGHSLPLGGEDLRLFVTWVGMGATLISRQELANFEAVPKSWSLLSPLQSFPPKGQRLLFFKKTPNVPVRIFSWTTGVWSTETIPFLHRKCTFTASPNFKFGCSVAKVCLVIPTKG